MEENDAKISDIIEIISELRPDMGISDKSVRFRSTETIEDHTYILEKKVETLEFDKKELESLVSDALTTLLPVKREINGQYHMLHDRSDDHIGEYKVIQKVDKTVNISLNLRIFKGTPIFFYSY